MYTAVRGTEGLFWQAADGSGTSEHLVNGTSGIRAYAWTRDGQLVFEELAGSDIRLLKPGSKDAPQSITLFDAPGYFNGVLPAVSRDGHWLAYQSTGTSPVLEVKAPEVLFRLSDYVLPGTRGIKYEVAPDGRFLMLKDSGGRSQDRVVLVQNWTEELKRLVPSN